MVVADDLLAELVGIDENLIREDLSVLEKGVQLARRNELLEALGMRAKVGDNQYSGGPATVAGPPKATADIVEEMGVSERTAQYYNRL